jgi:hypothetical protein
MNQGRRALAGLSPADPSAGEFFRTFYAEGFDHEPVW